MIVEDPDAPMVRPFVHLLAVNIPPTNIINENVLIRFDPNLYSDYAFIYINRNEDGTWYLQFSNFGKTYRQRGYPAGVFYRKKQIKT